MSGCDPILPPFHLLAVRTFSLHFLSIATAILGLLPPVPLKAAEESGPGKNLLESSLRKTTSWSSSLLGGDIEVRIHHRQPPEELTEKPRGILYLKNLGGPRIGTESDESILGDYVRRGYTVVTVDYRNDPRAVSPALEKEVFTLIKSKSKPYAPEDRPLDPALFTGIEKYQPFRTHILPPGYRVRHDIPYYDLVKHAPFGTLEKLVDEWNAKIVPSVPGAQPARDHRDLKMRNGSPMPTEYVMDVIYPSAPAAPVPILVRFATDVSKDPNAGERFWHFLGFTVRGGAQALVQHCHDPLYADYAKQLGYDNYSLVKWLGLGSSQAALRQLAADAASYGIDPGRILGFGHSKGQYFVTRMLNPDHARQKEYARIEGFPEGSPESQPYPDSPCKMAAGYQSAGWGNFLHSEKDYAGNPILTSDYLPTLVAVGEKDPFPVVEPFHAFVKKLRSLGVKNQVELFMPDIGHDSPQGWNPELQRDNYDVFLEFFDRFLKPQTTN